MKTGITIPRTIPARSVAEYFCNYIKENFAQDYFFDVTYDNIEREWYLSENKKWILRMTDSDSDPRKAEVEYADKWSRGETVLSNMCYAYENTGRDELYRRHRSGSFF